MVLKEALSVKKLFEQFDAQARTVVQGDLAVFNRHSREAVIGDQEITIQVGIVHNRRQISGSSDGTRGLGHATDHHLHVESAGQSHHLVGFIKASTLHQFDVNTVIYALELNDVGQTLEGLIGNDGQR